MKKYMPPPYEEMVSFLRKVLLHGIPVGCNLNSTYDVIKKEYYKHKCAYDLVKNKNENSLEIIRFFGQTSVEILINDESRIVSLAWDDISDSGLSLQKEIVCIPLDKASKEVLTRILITKDGDTYKAYPSSSYLQNSKIEWLSQNKNTVCKLIKGYLDTFGDSWKWLEVDENNQKIDILKSKYVLCCRQEQDEFLGIGLNYPHFPIFQRIDNKWVASGQNLTWIANYQSAMSYRFKDDCVVILQHEYNKSTNSIARFSIRNKWYDKYTLLALIECIVGNQFFKPGDTLIFPVIQLIPLQEN